MSNSSAVPGSPASEALTAKSTSPNMSVLAVPQIQRVPVGWPVWGSVPVVPSGKYAVMSFQWTFRSRPWSWYSRWPQYGTPAIPEPCLQPPPTANVPLLPSGKMKPPPVRKSHPVNGGGGLMSALARPPVTTKVAIPSTPITLPIATDLRILSFSRTMSVTSWRCELRSLYSGSHAAAPQTTPGSRNLRPRKEVKSLPVSCFGCAQATCPSNPRAPRNRRQARSQTLTALCRVLPPRAGQLSPHFSVRTRPAFPSGAFASRSSPLPSPALRERRRGAPELRGAQAQADERLRPRRARPAPAAHGAPGAGGGARGGGGP